MTDYRLPVFPLCALCSLWQNIFSNVFQFYRSQLDWESIKQDTINFFIANPIHANIFYNTQSPGGKMSQNFWTMISRNFEQNHSSLVVGLDPVYDRMPSSIENNLDGVGKFLTDIVSATSGVVCGYKPNFAFYISLGIGGLKILEKAIEHIKSLEIPVLLDGKFNDIGHTAGRYAKFAREIGADAVTVSPYIGRDTVKPFLDEGLSVIILCATSNPGFLDIEGITADDGLSLYQHVAGKAVEWTEEYGDKIGLVVGATHPDIFTNVREIAPNLPFLIPGIGAQGGDIESSVKAGITADSFPPLIVAARSVIYASSGNDFAEAARTAAIKLRDSINEAGDFFKN